MANQNNNSNANNSNSSNSTNTNTTNNNTNSHHTLNLHHNTNPLIISSSQLLSMPSLVAAAAAGITTTLIPLSNELNTQTSSQQQQQQQTNGTSNASNTVNTSGLNASTSSSLANSNNGLLDLIMCKLVAPFHVVNDPRLLECGASACFQCILSSKDSERNLKCPYCNNIHKLPIDINKLLVNKNLQTFLKSNFRTLNQSFSKQLEDSMYQLEQKIHSQNLSMESFDQYLTLIQNDVQMKVETMKNHLEKYGEQFIENLKLIRKEVQKQWIEHSNPTNTTNTTNSQTTTSATATLNNVVQQQQQQQQLQLQHQQLQQQQQQQPQQHHQLGKEKTFQLIGIKGEPLLQLQPNTNIMTLLGNQNNNGVNTNHSTYQLGTFHNPNLQSTNATNTNSTAGTSTGNNNTNAASSNNQSNNTSSTLNHDTNNTNKRNSSNHNSNANNDNNNSIINSTKNTNLLQHTGDALNSSLDVLQNTFNFSNSSSWNANDDDLDDFETDLSLKPVQTTNNSGGNNGQKRHLNKEQAQFNKFVREEVSKKFGEDFLLQHEVNQLESSIMELIKTEAIATFLPKDTTPARAWTLAKVSLRSLKRDLRRKQGISLKKDSQDCKLVNSNNHPYYDV